ncbi:CCA tRNA nucleotidyltransferase [Haloimpatiens sp. FM7330]|uniref:CCA tRNA nucleotidyltransferase n=1 Tax=Haloimpatiens sp. FM7330 TaxID=3298610 RepID=UPI0036271D40
MERLLHLDIINNFDTKEKDILEQLIKFFKDNDINAYIVGGAVRDFLLHKKPKDIDICVDTDPILFIENISNVKKINYYEKFQTSTLLFNNGVQIDIIRCRKEIYKYKGSLPDIIPSHIKDDLYRRDFTVNAMAYDLINDELIDIFGGLKDLKNKKLKKIRENTYYEDATRIFRAVRYSVRCDLKLVDEKEIMECVKNKVLNTVSNDRIIKELLLICEEDKWIEMYRKCSEVEILDLNLGMLGKDNKLFKYDDKTLRLLNLFLSLKDKSFKYKFIDNSIIDKDIKQAFKNIYYDEINSKELFLYSDNDRIYKVLNKLNPYDIMLMSWDKTLVYKIICFNKMKELDYDIKGKDIIEMSSERGKIIGEIIEYFNNLQLNTNLELGKQYVKENIGEIINVIKNKNT